ncbi:unnamed protein product [Adineta ricciae]|uniref:Transmembrane protein 120-like protein n=1 Tax=Adineta ricciae TaxID=249248 RepID=A0A816FJ26_ADIRI|nr:unnamed protein product [Adineta ricciae]CAF1662190.1 unnamed protein product [Adineta ricciae]
MVSDNQLQLEKRIKRRKKCSIKSNGTFDAETENLIQQWGELSDEINTFKEDHQKYLSQLETIEKLKNEHQIQFNKLEKKIQHLNESIDIHQSLIILPDNDNEKLEERLIRLGTIREYLIEQRSNYFQRIQYTLPQPSEIYLRIILGSQLPVSILNKSEQLKYKESYEHFKLRVTLILMIISLLMSTIIPMNRALDALFHFLLVWYYCTLTIRESILVVNGSKIQPWWRLHHFIATISTCIVLIWPSAESYQIFRQQHYVFSLYITFVQVLLYYYQRGLLYRLRALGDSDEFQISIGGFQSWMLRGLTFLAPFLVIGYVFQLYNAYVLFEISIDPKSEPNPHWQFMLKILSGIFLILFLGNSLTMYIVLRRKIRERVHDIQWLQHRYETVKTLINRVRSVISFQR